MTASVKLEEGEALIERGFMMLAEKSEDLIGVYVLVDTKTGRRHIGGCGIDATGLAPFLMAAADDVRGRTPTTVVDYDGGEGKLS